MDGVEISLPGRDFELCAGHADARKPIAFADSLAVVADRADRRKVARGQRLAHGDKLSLAIGKEAGAKRFDPAWHRHGIGTRLLLALAREGIERDATALTLEVRLSNKGAQEMYKRFGFTAVGVRKGYYADTGEDALVMWAYEVDQPPYGALLDGLERGIKGSTVYEAPKRW